MKQNPINKFTPQIPCENWGKKDYINAINLFLNQDSKYRPIVKNNNPTIKYWCKLKNCQLLNINNFFIDLSPVQSISKYWSARVVLDNKTDTIKLYLKRGQYAIYNPLSVRLNLETLKSIYNSLYFVTKSFSHLIRREKEIISKFETFFNENVFCVKKTGEDKCIISKYDMISMINRPHFEVCFSQKKYWVNISENKVSSRYSYLHNFNRISEVDSFLTLYSDYQLTNKEIIKQLGLTNQCNILKILNKNEEVNED